MYKDQLHRKTTFPQRSDAFVTPSIEIIDKEE